jgi:hemolysin III
MVTAAPVDLGRDGLYEPREELANAITHGLGAALAVVGLVLMTVQAAIHGSGWALASALVYGSTMLLLFGASTLYHAVPSPAWRHRLKILDHAAIYLLIAGSYTPFTLISLRDRGGWWMFGVVWACAVVGVALEALWVYRSKWLAAVVYVAMGWLIILMIKPLIAALPAGALWLLLAGGAAYTLGTAFYAQKETRFMHAIWHVFVLAGGVTHFLSVYLYVLRR